jgi:hypothetical protein
MKRIILLASLVTTHAFATMALNPDVTQSTINKTICVPGYTQTVRPSTTYTNGVKKKLMTAQGLSWNDRSDYELDHVVPLTLGGSPRSTDNLKLQPWEGADGAKVKDKLEMRLNKLVCTGKVKLKDAQTCIYKNWQACARKYP